MRHYAANVLLLLAMPAASASLILTSSPTRSVAKASPTQNQNQRPRRENEPGQVTNTAPQQPRGGVNASSSKPRGRGKTAVTRPPHHPVVVKSRQRHLCDAGSCAPTPRRVRPGPVVINKVGMVMALITAGDFCMGSTRGDWNERPVHRVHIGEAFYMGTREVTQAQWKAVMGPDADNPSHFKGDDLPVEMVSWDEAQEFIRRLNALDNSLPSKEYYYRLPTEAEWEYAARAGTTDERVSDLNSAAWYGLNSKRSTHPTGEIKRANPFGLFDMYGNVREWCDDWYQSMACYDPSGESAPHVGDVRKRIARGGDWDSKPYECRPANRRWLNHDGRYDYVGFRVAAVRDVEGPARPPKRNGP